MTEQRSEKTSENTITVIGRRDVVERGPEGRIRREQVSVSRIKSALSDFLTGMGEILGRLPDEIGDYELKSMDISVEVSSSGSISLMGVAGGEMGGTGGLVLHLEKAPPEKA